MPSAKKIKDLSEEEIDRICDQFVKEGEIITDEKCKKCPLRIICESNVDMKKAIDLHNLGCTDAFFNTEVSIPDPEEPKHYRLIDTENGNHVFYSDDMSDEDKKHGKDYFREIADSHWANEDEMIDNGTADGYIDGWTEDIIHAENAEELYGIAESHFDESGKAIVKLEEIP